MSAVARLHWLSAGMAVTIVLAAGCSPERDARRQIEVGQTQAEVVAALGEPDEVSEFTLPDEPFFGPQEGLVSLVPAGTFVLEWRYISGDDVRYVWFASERGVPREEWQVIGTAVHPVDAVY